MQTSPYAPLKKKILEEYFSRMNPMQRRAVFAVNGPVLILAGAGSGKTTVLINRILNLVRFGEAYAREDWPSSLSAEDAAFLQRWADGEREDEEHMVSLLRCRPVKPWNILAITFTNKAAGELRDRLAQSLGEQAQEINAATFHAACVRILRRHIDRLGYSSGFTIYDTDDSIRVIKKQMDLLRISDKNVKPRSLLGMISRAKDAMLSPADMQRTAGNDFLAQTAAKVYAGYQQELKSANAVDFDDIILLCVRLLEEHADVLEYYQNRYRYIMVDEYQDTNRLQYRLISLLAGAHQNLCVVGDDDQSIYKFRGATIENILSFEDQFPGAVVIRLEQNYRSTKNILDAANGVIGHNLERKGKNLWTQNETGEKLQVYRAGDEQGEARFICETIGKNIRAGGRFSDHAVLYRMNAQSNIIEREMTRSAIPYKIIGGLRFYERKEIKDAISYLSVIHNPSDNLRLTRIINEPKRGIGDATIAAALQIANGLGLSLFEVLRTADEYPALSRRALPILSFIRMIESFIEDEASGMPVDLLLESVLEKSGYLGALQAQGETEQTRIENLGELKSNVRHYMQEQEEATLAGFLEEIALYTDLDSYNDSEDRVVLMTVHSAKGLEFNHVFLAGTEEGIFPGSQSAYDPSQLEEERRLAYVAFTRARKELYITCSAMRMLFGSTSRNPISRFVKEIPESLYELNDVENQRHTLSPAARAHIERTAPSAAPESRLSAKSRSVAAAARPIQPAGAGLALAVGDRVEHSVYGSGTILSVKPMGGDRLIEIAFDSAGTKKVMANYARLKKMD